MTCRTTTMKQRRRTGSASKAPSFAVEIEVRAAGFQHVAGTDEVGRGCLAGPVVAAAVLLPPGLRIRGLRDSKELSTIQRERLASRITDRAVSVAYGVCSVSEIDSMNILRASLEAMRRSLAGLNPAPDFVLVDGNQEIHPLPVPQKTLVGGDARCHAIAAASVLAKVKRDALMQELDRQYPGYDLASHKGYATRTHIDAIEELGLSACHRKSFRLKEFVPADQPSFFSKS